MPPVDGGEPVLVGDVVADEYGHAPGERRLGHEPRVALLSYSNFGQPSSVTTERVGDAVAVVLESFDETPDADFRALRREKFLAMGKVGLA